MKSISSSLISTKSILRFPSYLFTLLIVFMLFSLAYPAVSPAKNIYDPWGEFSVIAPLDNSATNSKNINVIGKASPGAHIQVNGINVVVTPDGQFQSKIILTPGINNLNISALKQDGQARVIKRTVLLDQISPKLALTSPNNGIRVVSGYTVVTGKTEPGSVVQINGVNLAPDKQGNFSLVVNLSPGRNLISVIARDRAGNMSELIRTLQFADNRVTKLELPSQLKLGKRITLNYNLSLEGFVTTEVFDKKDQLIRTLAEDVLKNKGSNTVTWDGLDEAGILVPDDFYRFVVSAKDLDDKPMGKLEKSQIAVKVPEISMDNNNSLAFNSLKGEQAYLTGKLSDPARVTLTVYLDPKNIIKKTSVTYQQKGKFSVPWEGRDSAGKLVGDGYYNYVLEAVSLTDSSFLSQYKGKLCVDKGPPSISGLNLTAKTLARAGFRLQANYILSENALVTIQILDQGWKLVRTLTNGITRKVGKNNVNWDGKNTLGQSVSPGNYRIAIRAVDNLGNRSPIAFKAFTVTLPAKKTSQPQRPPTKLSLLPITSATESRRTYFSLQQSVVILAETGTKNVVQPRAYPPKLEAKVAKECFDPLAGETAQFNYSLGSQAVVNLTISVGSKVIKTLVSEQLQASGEHTVAWDGTDDNGQPAADGTYRFQLKAVNPQMPSLLSRFQGMLMLESRRPSLNIISVSPSPFISGKGNLNSRYSVSEPCTVTILVTDTHGIRIKSYSTEIRTAGNNNAMWDGRDDLGAMAPNGFYRITLTALDEAQKLSESVKATFSVYRLPQITKFEVRPTVLNPLKEKAIFSYELSAEAQVTVKVGTTGSGVQTLSSSKLASGPQRFEWDGLDQLNKIVADGNYQFTITAESPDYSVIKSVYRTNVTVEKAPPSIADLSLSASPFKAYLGRPLAVKYNVSEPVRVDVTISQNQEIVRQLELAASKRTGKAQVSWDGKDDVGQEVPRGDYTITVRAVDAVGQVVVQKATFRVLPSFGVYTSVPRPNDNDIPVDQQITLTFNDKVNKGKNFPGIALRVGEQRVPAKVELIENNQLRFTPSSPLANSTKYTVTIPGGSVQDSARKPMLGSYQLTFQTEQIPQEEPELEELDFASVVTASEAMVLGRKVTTLSLEEVKGLGLLAQKPGAYRALISLDTAVDEAQVLVTGELLDAMAKDGCQIELRTPQAAMIIPLKQISPQDLQLKLAAITLRLVIAKVDASSQTKFVQLTKNIKYKLRAGGYSFRVEGLHGEEVIKLKQNKRFFRAFVYLTEKAPSASTGAAYLNPQGLLNPLPAQLIVRQSRNAVLVKLRNSCNVVVLNGIKTFRDSQQHWAKAQITEVASKLILQGQAVDRFAPEAKVTRAEVACIIVRTLGLSQEGGKSSFDDVKEQQWYYNDLATAVEVGLIHGFPDNTYRPEGLVSREELALVLAGVFGMLIKEEEPNLEDTTALLSRFKDRQQVSDWGATGLAVMVKNKLITGNPRGYLYPKRPVTRGELAVILQRILS